MALSDVTKLTKLLDFLKQRDHVPSLDDPEALDRMFRARQYLTDRIINSLATDKDNPLRLIQHYIVPIWAFRVNPTCACCAVPRFQKETWKACDALLHQQPELTPNQCFFCQHTITSGPPLQCIIEILQLIDERDGGTCFLNRFRLTCAPCQLKHKLGVSPNSTGMDVCIEALSAMFSKINDRDIPSITCQYSEAPLSSASNCLLCSRPWGEELMDPRTYALHFPLFGTSTDHQVTLYNSFCGRECEWAFSELYLDTSPATQPKPEGWIEPGLELNRVCLRERIRWVKAISMMDFMRQFRRIAPAHRLVKFIPRQKCEKCHQEFSESRPIYHSCPDCQTADWCSRLCARRAKKSHPKICRRIKSFVTYGAVYIVNHRAATAAATSLTLIPEEVYK